jgi:phage FluMu gp28-like protein
MALTKRAVDHYVLVLKKKQKDLDDLREDAASLEISKTVKEFREQVMPQLDVQLDALAQAAQGTDAAPGKGKAKRPPKKTKPKEDDEPKE